MTDRLAVTLTTAELGAIVEGAVMRALAARAVTDERARDLASEEMTIEDVLALFHRKTPKTIYRWRKRYGFPAPRENGGRVLWLRSDVDRWRAARATSGPGAQPDHPEGSTRRRQGGRAANPAH